MKSIVLHTEAREELDDAIAYYEARKPGLGIAFLVVVEKSIQKIQRNPRLGAPYTIPGLRRYVLQGFPFLIFYSEFEELIWVVAVAHAKRQPDYWKHRRVE